jgi:hypothetical protein
MNVGCRTARLVGLLVMFPAALHAQAGRADLRYVAPLPAVVTFTTVDSLHNTISGLPMADMKMSGTMHATNELRFVPVENGFAVTATLLQMSGAMTTPMGSVPLDASDITLDDFTIGVRGPDNMAAGPGAVPNANASPADLMGTSRAMSGLIRVPGRELRIGESWGDTLHVPQTVEELTVEMTFVSRGTYASDSIVAGRILNVLRITSEVTLEMTGAAHGMTIGHSMHMTTEETVLWDSARHIPLYRDAVTQTRSEAFTPQQDMPLHTVGRLRSIATAEPQG